MYAFTLLALCASVVLSAPLPLLWRTRNSHSVVLTCGANISTPAQWVPIHDNVTHGYMGYTSAVQLLCKAAEHRIRDQKLSHFFMSVDKSPNGEPVVLSDGSRGEINRKPAFVFFRILALVNESA